MEDYRNVRSTQVSFENKIRSLITDIRFSCIGNISKVYAKGKRVDVVLPYLTVNNEPITLKGIEVLRQGTHKVKITYTPEIGDAVIVLAMQNYNGSTKFAHTPLPKDQCPYFELYGNTTMKAILVQTNEDNANAINIKVNDTQLEIECPVSVSITCKDTTTISCKADLTVSCNENSNITVNASNSDVSISASKFSVNGTQLTVGDS